MPRLDVRVRTQLPAKAFCSNEATNILITELSLSGALTHGLDHGHEGIFTIRPELAGYGDVHFTGELLRQVNGSSIFKLYISDRKAKSALWQYIKKHLSLSNSGGCPYCGNANHSGGRHCGNCGWFLGFHDKDYLDRHERERPSAGLPDPTGAIQTEYFKGVMNVMDTELLEHKGLSRDDNRTFSTERFHSLYRGETGSPPADLSGLHAAELELRSRYCFDSILGHHHRMIEVLKFISRVADTGAAVLIRGESGTGKELVARALHNNSRRREKPFVPVNCSALPENLLETEMFGHVRGAFTGAVRDRAGWFERAAAGTIFLDEVSEMPPSLQVKLLRVLQSGEYSRVGSTEILRCDVRILTATNADMQQLVKEGKFREDLYYRINVLDIEIPPLRERRCDIPLLIRHYLKIYGLRHGRDNIRMARDAEAVLLSYDFPGNVRELENIIQRAVILSDGPVIETRHLPPAVVCQAEAACMHKEFSSFKAAKRHAVEQFERRYIIDCLKATGGNISSAARIAGINVKNFYDKMRKYAVNPHSYKQPNKL